MAKLPLAELAKLVVEAQAEGQKAADATEDGGTCNLDTVVIYGYPGTSEASMQKAGIDCYKLRRAGNFALSGCSFGGQANKRNRGVEAMCKYLSEHGVDCFVHYQMD